MKYSLVACIYILVTTATRVESAWKWTDVATGAAVGTTAVVAAPFVLSAAGFTAGGVAAGSIAAGAQSAFYAAGVTSGSVFSVLQSAGAAGIGMKAGAAIFTAATRAGAYVKNLLF